MRKPEEPEVVSARHVFVVEDSDDGLATLSGIVKRSFPADVRATVFQDHYQFFGFVSARFRQLPDLVLVDLSLFPSIDISGLLKADYEAARTAGYRVLEMLHDEFHTPKIPVIICTETPARDVHATLSARRLPRYPVWQKGRDGENSLIELIRHQLTLVRRRPAPVTMPATSPGNRRRP